MHPEHPSQQALPVYNPLLSPLALGVDLKTKNFYHWDFMKHQSLVLSGPAGTSHGIARVLVMEEFIRRGFEVLVKAPNLRAERYKEGEKEALTLTWKQFLEEVKEDLQQRRFTISDERLPLWDPKLVVMQGIDEVFFHEGGHLQEILSLAEDTEVFFLFILIWGSSRNFMGKFATPAMVLGMNSVSPEVEEVAFVRELMGEEVEAPTELDVSFFLEGDGHASMVKLFNAVAIEDEDALRYVGFC